MRYVSLLLLCLILSFHILAQTGKPLLTPASIYSLKQLRDPRIAPEGNWILYGMSVADSLKDQNTTRLFMVSRDGKETVALTEQTTDPSAWQWSPDGKYISFLAGSKKDEVKGRQVFLMDRRGGEPVQLTSIKGEIETYQWSPDGEQLVLVIKDPSTADTAKTKIRQPYEINRYHFKQDYAGYLDNRKSHLYLYGVATKKLDTLTRGLFNESDPSFHPAGSSIAFVSNHTADPDRNANTDIFLINLTGDRAIRQLTTFKGSNFAPRFSPDGNKIAFLQSSSPDNFNMYDLTRLAIQDLSTGMTTILTEKLDRSVGAYCWAANNEHLYAMIEDDRRQNIYRVSLTDQSVTTVAGANDVFSALSTFDGKTFVALFSDVHTPNEIWLMEKEQAYRVTRLQDDFTSRHQQVFVKGFQSISADNTKVSGILYLPDSSARNLPLVLFIHGGPVAQDEYSFDLSRQILSAAGFAVAAVNYRGSSGRGYQYCRSIYADWGNKEVQDIIGAADYLIREGIADANRLAIGGWSYGGILTNYTIARDTRFKAAVSGAGSSFQFAMYGTDQYVVQYEEELGAPWKNTQKWMDLSYPFFKVERIKTPTLFMASQNDFNVPVAGSEQMYQAFRSVGISTELVIYPNQHHGVSVPSYIIHRFNRHIEWFRKYLK